jgi:uncharacterized protein
MKNTKVVIAGGTGFIGNYISKQLKAEGYEVIIIARQKNYINWDDILEISNALNGAEMLINLAGKSVDCRYNEANKNAILNSRIDTTQILGNAILACEKPPKLWINSSTATIYRHADDRPMTESTGDIGQGFSVGVAKAWEKSFFDFNLANTRQVALRIAIVLGKDGGALTPIANLAKFGFGGKQGVGNQMFSWLHIADLYSMIMFINIQKNVVGVVNCSSPNPVTNSKLMTMVRQAVGVKLGLPMPKFLLSIGAFVIRTEPELILKSRWVLPERLLAFGFEFKYPKLEEALKDILGS